MSMDTSYCDECGLLYDPEEGECVGCKLVAEKKELQLLVYKLKTTLNGVVTALQTVPPTGAAITITVDDYAAHAKENGKPFHWWY